MVNNTERLLRSIELKDVRLNCKNYLNGAAIIIMSNIEEEDIVNIAKVLLSLGHSFLRGLTVEEKKQVVEDEKNKVKEDEKVKIIVGNKKILDNEMVKNVKNGVQTEMTDIDENMQEEPIVMRETLVRKKSDNNGNKQQESKDQMNNEDKGEKSSKFHGGIQTESNKNVQNEANNEKYEVEKEVANEFDKVIQPKYKIDVQKELNNEICQKSEVVKENDNEMHVDPMFLQESVEIMQEKPQVTEKDSEIGLNVDMQDPIYQNKLDGNLQEEPKENQQTSENFREIQLLVQFDKSALPQELGGKVQEELDIENQIIPGRYIQIEINIELEGNSKCQQQLIVKVQEELDQEKQLISEEDQEIDIEITKVLDKNELIDSNDENKEFTTTVTGQSVESNLQFVFKKKLKTDTKEDRVEFNNISQEQLDKEIQQEVEQTLYHHKIVLGLESREKRKLLEQEIETLRGDVVQKIERFTSEIQNKGLDEEIQKNIAESAKQIQKKIDELKKKIDESKQKYDDELLKEIDKIHEKTNIPVAQEKFVENLNLFFENQSAPLVDKSEQLYNLIPPTVRESFKIPTEYETDLQQEIDNTLKDLNEVNIDEIRVNQKLFNEETQEVNEEIQANSEIQHEDNIDEERVSEEDKQLEFHHKKKRANREMQETDKKLSMDITNDPKHYFGITNLKKKINEKKSNYFYVLITIKKVIEHTNDGQVKEVVKISELDYNKKTMERLYNTPKNAPKNIKKALKLQFDNKVEKVIDGLVQKYGINMMSKKFYEESSLKLGEETKPIINKLCNEIGHDFEGDMKIQSEEEIQEKVIKEIQKNVEEQINEVKQFKNNEGEVQEEHVVHNDNAEEETQLQDYGEIHEESDVCVDDFEEEIPVIPLIFDEECLSSNEECEVRNEVNEVTEIVEDFITEYIPPVSNSNPKDEETSSAKESSSTEESSSAEESSSTAESSSTEEGYKFNGITQQLNDEQHLYKKLQNPKKQEKNFSGKKFDQNQNLDHNREEKLKAFKMHNDLMAEMFDVPLDDEQHLEKKLQNLKKQKKNFSGKKFDQKQNQDHNREEELKAFKMHNDLMAAMFDEQHQQYYQLKEGITHCRIDMDTFMQSEMFDKLQKEMVEDDLLGPDCFSEKFIKEPSDPSLYHYIHKDVVELQHEVEELEPLFKNDIDTNIPFEFAEDNLKQPSTPEPYDLFEKLYSIHRKKLCEFVDSKEWPECCLVPSSLLDALFDDPLEFKPNVLVITLYCADIGFSIKITRNKNEPPEEIFYCYKKDETLFSFIESEKLPPTLLELLDESDKNLFYSGCVIGEIHDLEHGAPGRIGRILLRPCNESIIQDTKNLIHIFNDRVWTLESKLRLEKKIFKLNYPRICSTDILPATGVARNLQHFLLNPRKLELNPLKRKYPISSKLNMEMDFPDDFKKYNSSSESQTSSHLVDTAIQEVHYILWMFDFRIPSSSFNIIKLYVMISSLNKEFSILLCINSEDGSPVTLRFKINLQANVIKTYIMEVLKFLKHKLRPDLEVIRRYKNNVKSPPCSVTCVPALFNDNIYEPSFEDLSQLINELLNHKSDYESNKTEYNKIEYPVVPINKLPGDTQKTERNPILSKQMDHTINFCDSNNLSRRSYTNINMFDLNLRRDEVPISKSKISDMRSSFFRAENESLFTNPKAIDSSTSKSPRVPLDVLVNHDTILSPKERSITGKNSDVESSLSSQMLVSIGNTSVNVNQAESGSISKILSTSISATEILPPISSSLVITSSASDILTVIPSVPSAVNVLSSLSRPITVIASVPSRVTVVSSTTSNMSSTEASIKLPSHKEHSVRLDNILKSDHQSVNLYDIMKSDPRKIFTQPPFSKYQGNISVVKHMHDNRTCMKGFKTVINSKKLPLKAVLMQKGKTIKDHKLDCQKKPEKLNDILNTDVAGPSNIQINEDSFQETNNQSTSSDIKDCRGLKRKEPTL